MNRDVYHNIVWKKFGKYFKGTSEQEINEYFHFDKIETPYCGYCGVELKAHTTPPYHEAPSIDHKTPLSSGGTNTFDNIMLCCTRCNIVKGTMNSETYIKFLELIYVEPLEAEKIRNELFLGRKAAMLNRKEKEDRRLHDFI